MNDSVPLLIGLGVCIGLVVAYTSLRLRNRFAPYRDICWGILILGSTNVLAIAGAENWIRFSAAPNFVRFAPAPATQFMAGAGLIVAMLAAVVAARAFRCPWRREVQRTLTECVVVAILVSTINLIAIIRHDQQKRDWFARESYRIQTRDMFRQSVLWGLRESKRDLINSPEKMKEYILNTYMDRERSQIYRDYTSYLELLSSTPKEFVTKEQLESDLGSLRLSALGSWLLAASILPWFMRRVRVPDKLPLYVRQAMAGINKPATK